MSNVMRIKELKTKRTRRSKLATLRKRFAATQNEQDKEQILEKVKRVAPWLSSEEFLSPLNK